MTNEDKKLVTDYMDWSKDYGYVEEYDSFRELDLNDAGLCVQEMQKRGDWERFCANVFILFIDEEKSSYLFPKYIAWLFNAENFFAAMAAYLKEGKK